MKSWKATDERPFSSSCISSFRWNKEEWYQKYYLGWKPPASAEMLFGSEIGTRIATDPKFLPHLPRAAIFEYAQPDGLRVMFGKIPLIGYIDAYTEHNLLREYKTGKKAWTQKRVDEHDQITMYLFMLYLKFKIKPENIETWLHWMPTKETGDFKIEFTNPRNPIVHSFKTKRTIRQLLDFGMYINKTYKEMQEYVRNHE